MDILCAALFIAICVPLILKKIPPNIWYGFRIPKAFRSDENWYLINAYGGKALTLWSLPLLVTGVLKFFVPFEHMDAPWAPMWLLGPVIVCSVAAIIQTLVYAWRL
jgi:hypothetical protein